MEGNSIVSLILDADFIVKLVMLILLAASIFSWGIILDKTIKLKKQMRKADIFEQYFWSGQALKDVYNNSKHKKKDSALIRLFVVSIQEYTNLKSANKYTDQRIGEKVRGVMEKEQRNIISNFEHSVDWLATIGSTAPFIGLLGTVWGIMNSFQSIALTKNTTLAVVAPSIAEALLATAGGLIVAIPAVIFYNRIVIKIETFTTRMKDFVLNLQLLLMKGLDE